MKIRFMAAALAALFLLPVFSMTVLAAPDEDLETPQGEVDEVSSPDHITLNDVTLNDVTLNEEIMTDVEEIHVTGGYDPEAPVEPIPELRPFTPAGTGTVVDYATDGDGKEFYTITTPDENVFYLVIDRQRSTENVYFLNAVTEADLMALAEIPAIPVAAPVIETEPAPAPEVETPEPPPVPEKKSNMGVLLFVIAVILIGGAAGWYFKIHKPKQEKMENADDYDYSSDDYDDEAEDDGMPPWDIDDEDDGGDIE